MNYSKMQQKESVFVSKYSQKLEFQQLPKPQQIVMYTPTILNHNSIINTMHCLKYTQPIAITKLPVLAIA